jgi:glycosyltransferase involved in cell wall biosynthesis
VAGVFIREHARAAALTADVAVVHLHREQQPKRRFAIEDIAGEDFPTIRVRYPHDPTTASYAAHLAGAAAAWRRLRSRGFDPDVIHAHFFLAGFPAVLLGALYRKSVVVSEHWSVFLPEDPSSLPALPRRVACFTFKHADLVLTPSEALARALRGLEIGTDVRVVPNVVDDTVFRPEAARGGSGPQRLLTVGLLYEAKGIEYLLEAVRQLRERRDDFRLDIVGDGPARARWESLGSELGVADVVTFHGMRSKPEIAALMRSSDLFVLPSRYENSPCVIVEALASGLPVVATRVGGVPELVEDGFGLLAVPGDPVSLAETIEQALQTLDRFDRGAIAAAARARYGLEAVGRTLAEAYAACAGTAPPRSTGRSQPSPRDAPLSSR